MPAYGPRPGGARPRPIRTGGPEPAPRWRRGGNQRSPVRLLGHNGQELGAQTHFQCGCGRAGACACDRVLQSPTAAAARRVDRRPHPRTPARRHPRRRGRSGGRLPLHPRRRCSLTRHRHALAPDQGAPLRRPTGARLNPRDRAAGGRHTNGHRFGDLRRWSWLAQPAPVLIRRLRRELASARAGPAVRERRGVPAVRRVQTDGWLPESAEPLSCTTRSAARADRLPILSCQAARADIDWPIEDQRVGSPDLGHRRGSLIGGGKHLKIPGL